MKIHLFTADDEGVSRLGKEKRVSHALDMITNRTSHRKVKSLYLLVDRRRGTSQDDTER